MRLIVDKTNNQLRIMEWDQRITHETITLDSKIARMILEVARRRGYTPETP